MVSKKGSDMAAMSDDATGKELSDTEQVDVLRERPSVFFDSRITFAFPGMRGLVWIADGKTALDDLQMLLREPLVFKSASGYEVYPDPFAWFRGGRGGSISSFRRLSSTRCLLNCDELEIDKVAAYRSGSYKKSFVYIETRSNTPTGLYPVNEDSIACQIETFGFAQEQYGLFGGQLITNECLSDGAAIIEGVRVNTIGAEYRTRYLSRYNLIIAPKFSPMLAASFACTSEPILNDMLIGKNRMSELIEMLEGTPIQEHDC
jgi:hypothetical protein